MIQVQAIVQQLLGYEHVVTQQLRVRCHVSCSVLWLTVVMTVTKQVPDVTVGHKQKQLFVDVLDHMNVVVTMTMTVVRVKQMPVTKQVR